MRDLNLIDITISVSGFVSICYQVHSYIRPIHEGFQSILPIAIRLQQANGPQPLTPAAYPS